MNMKKIIIKTAAFATLIAGLSACGYDNFNEPESTLKGSIQYNGQNVRVKGTGNTIQLKLYQSGYELKSPITIFVDQDGNFSTKLFNGDYKLVTKDKNGPWVNSRDTIEVKVKGNTSITVNVTPYFIISNPACSLNGSSGSASFNIEQVVSSTTISYGYVIVGHTSLIDEQNNDAAFQIPASSLHTGSNTIPVTLTSEQQSSLKALYDRYKKISVRMSIRSTEASESNYSEIINLAL